MANASASTSTLNRERLHHSAGGACGDGGVANTWPWAGEAGGRFALRRRRGHTIANTNNASSAIHGNRTPSTVSAIVTNPINRF